MARRRTTKGTKPRARVSVTAPADPRARPGPDLGGSAPRQSTSVDQEEPQALVATHWFDSGDAGARDAGARDAGARDAGARGAASEGAGGEPYSVTVRFTGRRIGAHSTPRSGDTFSQDEVIDGIVPGTGPVSITSWIYGVEPGEWMVTGQLIRDSRGSARPGPGARSSAPGGQPVRPAAWSWRRWTIGTGPDSPIKTRWALLAPIARQPAVLPGIYTLLAILGITFALVVQAAILGRGDIPVGRTLTASAIAIVFGLIGAKLWYAVLHPDESIIKGGWAVDGFLIVVPVVAAVTLLLFDLPIGVVLDASTPGIFFAVVIGRIGCFFTGCCAGRCTASRWGIWSSDRRVGARRIPTQLLESGAGLVIGVVTLLLVLGGVSPVPGAIFVAAFAAYAVVRQILLRLRVERRKSARSVPLTGVAAAIVVIVVLVMVVLQGSPAG
ncbi:MAG: prolipoprotein diacylglyceryl transferase [Chloroflexi bacterium]|nr:prolipoprotein diacylglyceryl transferase [Chloroflexota bacterium]